MGSIASTLRHPGRVYYGWRMVALVGVMSALNSAFYSRGATVFLIPVQTSLELNRATASLIFSLARSEGALGGPAFGYLVDRFGTRKMLTIGTILAGAGFIIFATASHLWVFVVAYMLFISLGATTAFEDSPKAMIAKWFSRFRVRAMAVREASGSLGASALIPLMVLVIAAFGWQAAAIMAAVGYLVIILPLTRLIKDSPESIGLLPDGATLDQVAAARRASTQRKAPLAGRGFRHYDQGDFTVKEALRTTAYWSLLIGTMLRQTAKAGIEVHLVAIFVWRGMDLATAGLVFTLWVGLNVPAKLLMGYFADRVPIQVALAGGMLLNVLAFVLLLTSHTVWLVVVVAVVGGTSEGVTPINWGAIGEYFGRSHYATLRGIINLSYSWAWLLLPFASGWWFDHHSNYTVPLLVSIVASVASAAAYASIRRPRLPARLAAGPDPAGAGLT